MEIYYEEGPPRVGMGAAGVFEKGVSREIDDELAKQILAKKSVVFKEGKSEAPAPAQPKDKKAKAADQQQSETKEV